MPHQRDTVSAPAPLEALEPRTLFAAAPTLLGQLTSPGEDDLPQHLFDAGRYAYYRTADTLWRTDGSRGGTVAILDGHFDDPDINKAQTLARFVNFKGKTWFTAYSGGGPYRQTLWSTGGTAATTRSHLIADINSPLMPLGDAMIFAGNPQDDIDDVELWRTDGTAGGTFRLRDLRPGGVRSQPRLLTPLRDRVVFFANGSELWVTDGTPSGTQRIRRFTGFVGLSAMDATADAAFFVIRNAGFDQVWKTDGTGAGTTRIGTIPARGYGARVVATSQTAFVITLDEQAVESPIYATDGTPADLRLVGRRGRYLDTRVFEDRLFFVDKDKDIWVSDGSAAGTRLAADVPGGQIFILAHARGRLFFEHESDNGVLTTYSTDGTVAGTPTVGGDSFLGLGHVSGKLVWLAGSAASGYALYSKAISDISGDSDLDGNRWSDLVYSDPSSRTITLQRLQNGAFKGTVELRPLPGTDWHVAAVGDLDRDGDPDLLLRHPSTGANRIYVMDGTTWRGTTWLPAMPDAWGCIGIADMDHDGTGDILWRNPAGKTIVWLMNRGVRTSTRTLGSIGSSDEVVAVGDVDGDGNGDLFRHDPTTRRTRIDLLDGATVRRTVTAPPSPFGAGWVLGDLRDLDEDGDADVIWRNTTTGQNRMWVMHAGRVHAQRALPALDVEWELPTMSTNTTPPAQAVRGRIAEGEERGTRRGGAASD